ncbi:MAG: hypothetical protein AABW92_02815 [Nanoarchaeota archaeon]
MLDFLVASSLSEIRESVAQQIKDKISNDARITYARNIDEAIGLYHQSIYAGVILIDDFQEPSKTAIDFLKYIASELPMRDRRRIYVTNQRNIEPVITSTYGSRCIGTDIDKVAERILPFLQG